MRCRICVNEIVAARADAAAVEAGEADVETVRAVDAVEAEGTVLAIDGLRGGRRLKSRGNVTASHYLM